MQKRIGSRLHGGIGEEEGEEDGEGEDDKRRQERGQYLRHSISHMLLISGEMVKIKTRIRNRNRGKKSYIGFDRRKEIEDFGLVSSILISLLLFVLVFFR